MKLLLAICMIVTTTLIWAGENLAPAKPAATTVKGDVLEVADVDLYTYVRLKTNNGETWAAVPKTALRKGDKIAIENVSVMNNFESKSLKKTFPTILFGTLAGAGGMPAKGNGMTTAQPAAVKAMEAEDIRVPKAVGPNARTVAEVTTKSAELKDKPVLVRGKIVKYNEGIMGKNWIHLRDGSGSAANNSNDILVTTKNQAKNGDIVTAKGIVRTDKDFGMGYAYKVLIEEATLQQ
ncbi:MAG: nucleotide-binding protein [Sterolibacterium sp.]